MLVWLALRLGIEEKDDGCEKVVGEREEAWEVAFTRAKEEGKIVEDDG